MKLYKKKICSILIIISILSSGTVAYAAAGKYSVDDAGNDFYQALKTLDSVYYKDIDYEAVVNAALSEAFNQLDAYTEYMTEGDYNEYFGIGQVSKAGIGISMRLNGVGNVVVLDVFKGSPAENAGIAVRDILIKVNGNTIQGHSLNEIKDLIVGSTGTSAVITVMRGGTEKEITVTRDSYIVPTVQKKDISSLISGADNAKAAYIQISSFVGMSNKPEFDTGIQFEKIYNELKDSGVNNLIIDLRANTGGDITALLKIAKLLVKEGVIFQTVAGDGHRQIFSSSKKDKDFNLAVLVDGDTASSSEILASAIQESSFGTIIGTNTFGKGVGQVIVPTADNSHYMKITSFEVITRDGGKLNEIGVIPDILFESPPYIYSNELIDSHSSKEDIQAIRKSFAFIGYNIDANKDVFDDALVNIIKQFQKDAKLQISGMCTVDTIGAVNRHITDKYMQKDDILEAAYNYLVKELPNNYTGGN